jgi:hypothetical protein
MAKHTKKVAYIKCYGGGNQEGLCMARQGRVLSIEEWMDPTSIPEREFCQHRKDGMCRFNLKGE